MDLAGSPTASGSKGAAQRALDSTGQSRFGRRDLALALEGSARAMYLLVILGSVGFDKGFAHLHLTVGRVDVWVTEIGMVLIGGFLLGRNLLRGQLMRRLPSIEIWLVVFVLWGVIVMARRTAPVLSELHDFALVYYCLFFFFFRELFWSVRHLALLGAAFGLGVASIVVASGFDLATQRLDLLPNNVPRYASGQAGLQVAVALCFVAAFWNFVSRRPIFIGLTIAMIGTLILVQQRSLMLALLVALAVMLGLDARYRSLLRRSILLGAAGCGALVAAGQVLLPRTPVSQYLLHAEERLVAGLTNPFKDPTASFRLSAWTEALRRLRIHPLVGQGFGVPFQWRWNSLEIVNRPHNTYLWVAVTTGLIGLALLIGIVTNVYVIGLQNFKLSKALDRRIRLGLIGGFTTYLIFGVFNLLLESPYLAVVFWTLAAALTMPLLADHPYGLGQLRISWTGLRVKPFAKVNQWH